MTTIVTIAANLAEFGECKLYDKVPSNKPVFGVEYCDSTAAGLGKTQVIPSHLSQSSFLTGAASQAPQSL